MSRFHFVGMLNLQLPRFHLLLDPSCHVCRPERRQLWAVELALGSLPFSAESRKWKGPFVNGFECTSPIPFEMGFLNC